MYNQHLFRQFNLATIYFVSIVLLVGSCKRRPLGRGEWDKIRNILTSGKVKATHSVQNDKLRSKILIPKDVLSELGSISSIGEHLYVRLTDGQGTEFGKKKISSKEANGETTFDLNDNIKGAKKVLFQIYPTADFKAEQQIHTSDVTEKVSGGQTLLENEFVSYNPKTKNLEITPPQGGQDSATYQAVFGSKTIKSLSQMKGGKILIPIDTAALEEAKKHGGMLNIQRGGKKEEKELDKSLFTDKTGNELNNDQVSHAITKNKVTTTITNPTPLAGGKVIFKKNNKMVGQSSIGNNGQATAPLPQHVVGGDQLEAVVVDKNGNVLNKQAIVVPLNDDDVKYTPIVGKDENNNFCYQLVSSLPEVPQGLGDYTVTVENEAGKKVGTSTGKGGKQITNLAGINVGEQVTVTVSRNGAGNKQEVTMKPLFEVKGDWDGNFFEGSIKDFNDFPNSLKKYGTLEAYWLDEEEKKKKVEGKLNLDRKTGKISFTDAIGDKHEGLVFELVYKNKNESRCYRLSSNKVAGKAEGKRNLSGLTRVVDQYKDNDSNIYVLLKWGCTNKTDKDINLLTEKMSYTLRLGKEKMYRAMHGGTLGLHKSSLTEAERENKYRKAVNLAEKTVSKQQQSFKNLKVAMKREGEKKIEAPENDELLVKAGERVDVYILLVEKIENNKLDAIQVDVDSMSDSHLSWAGENRSFVYCQHIYKTSKLLKERCTEEERDEFYNLIKINLPAKGGKLKNLVKKLKL